MTTVTRNVTTTTRFGKVITYRVELDGVTFTAERTVGIGDDYSVSATVGRCGMSFHQPCDRDGNPVRVSGGGNVSGRFLAVAREIRQDPARFLDSDHADATTRSAALCTDEEACGRFRTRPPRDLTAPTDADLARADTAGTYAYNVGRPKVWHEEPRMRALIPADEQHTDRARRLIEVFEHRWQANADYATAKAQAANIPACQAASCGAPLVRRDPATLTAEQAWCGEWWDHPATDATRYGLVGHTATLLIPSRELAAQPA